MSGVVSFWGLVIKSLSEDLFAGKSRPLVGKEKAKNFCDMKTQRIGHKLTSLVVILTQPEEKNRESDLRVD